MERTYTIDDLATEMAYASDFDEFQGKRSFTKTELLKLVAYGLETIGFWRCFSCDKDTFSLGEDFYVHDQMWRAYGVEGVLCLGCLEVRVGRELTAADFVSGGPEDGSFPDYVRSDRLMDRLSRRESRSSDSQSD